MAESPAAKAKLTSAFTLFGKSKDLVLKNLALFAPLYLLPLVFQLLPLLMEKADVTGSDGSRFNNFVGGLSPAGMGGLVGFGIGILLVTIVVMFFIQAMLYALELRVTAGTKTDFNQLFEIAKKFWLRILGLGIIVGLLLVGGFLLFIIPGLIVLRRYFLAQFYLIDQDLSISEAMRKSAEESKKYSGSVWGIIGVMILLSLPNTIPGIGPFISFFLIALYSVAPALRYREIRALIGSGDKTPA